MSSLPPLAKFFFAAICLSGLACALAVALCLDSAFKTGSVGPDLIVFIVLALLAGRAKVPLIPRKHSQGEEDTGSMSLGFALVFASMLRFGPAGAMLVGAASTLFGCLFPKRQPTYQILFNVSLNVIETTLSGLIFVHVNGNGLALNSLQCFPAVVSSCLSFFVINTGAVATIIALCSQQGVYSVWKESFLWTAPSYFAGAGASILAILLLGKNVGASLLFCSPVFYLTYCSYKMYAGRAEEKQKHIEELQTSQEQLASLYLAIIKSLALAIDAKDQYTHQHILRVQRYAVATAREMGIGGGELEGINTGALLHDIGKLGVPEYVLLKPGKLTAEEFDKVKKHPEIGAAILDPVEFPWPVLPAVKYHHEKWDGSGYPEGLRGEQIPLPGRILAVADAYDALTSNRSYRNALTHDNAIRKIQEGIGSHFDPDVAEAFLRIIDNIVEQMARDNEGPLVQRPALNDRPLSSKSDEAAREIHRASSELWALYEVAQTLSSSLGLQETLDILARKLEVILPGTACVFLLCHGENVVPGITPPPAQLTARVAVGINHPFFAGCRTLSAQSRSLQVAQSHGTYIGAYDMDDLMLASSQTEPWIDIHSALIVPIIHQGEVLGTINLYHPQRDAFGIHDQQLLEMISERAAMALYNGILYDRTRSRASTDPLTGLYNVHYLTEYVEERCAKAERRFREREMQACSAEGAQVNCGWTSDRFALLCLDLDSFKPINDLFGHQKGDQVLRDLSQIFREQVGETDVVARYGGDEFLIVLNQTDATAAQVVTDILQRAVTSYDPRLVHDTVGVLRIGVSIGVASYPEDGKDTGTLLSVADRRMYRSKAERKIEQLIERRAECSNIKHRLSHLDDAAIAWEAEAKDNESGAPTTTFSLS